MIEIGSGRAMRKGMALRQRSIATEQGGIVIDDRSRHPHNRKHGQNRYGF